MCRGHSLRPYARSEVVFLEGRIGIAAQGRCRPGHDARIALDLRLELDCGLLQRHLLEWLVGRDRGGHGKAESRGGEARAKKAKHGDSPPEAADRRELHFKSRWCRAHGRGQATL